MIPPYTIFFFAIAAMLWAIYTKYQRRKIKDLITLSLSAIAIVVNVAIVYQMILENISIELHLVQMTACSIIVPLSYTYFAHQLGRQKSNDSVNTILWALVLISYIPEIIICNPFKPLIIPESGLNPFVFYILSNGEKLFAISTSDLVICIQSFVCLWRIVVLMIKLRRYNLHFNRKVYAFCVCLILAAIFIIMLSNMDYDDLRSTFGKWFYFGMSTTMIAFFNILIAKGYDLYPIETEQGEVVEDLELYVKNIYSQLARNMQHIMKKEELYLDPQLSADAIIERLHTNHTYFSQMMANEWGMSFSEYLNSLRLEHVERLLADDSLTIAAIATQSGFTDHSYMGKKFKAKHNVTPSEWRRIKRNESLDDSLSV